MYWVPVYGKACVYPPRLDSFSPSSEGFLSQAPLVFKAGVKEPALLGAFSSAHGGRDQSVGREAAKAASPLTHHSTIALHFYGSLGFLLKHSQLQSCSLLSPQAVSSQPQQSFPHVCSPNPMFQHPAPVPTSGHSSQAGACSVVAWTFCVSLTLSCLP